MVLFEPILHQLPNNKGKFQNSFQLQTSVRLLFVYVAADDIGFLERLLSGGTAGAISIAIMNPTEVIKTQMQV